MTGEKKKRWGGNKKNTASSTQEKTGTNPTAATATSRGQGAATQHDLDRRPLDEEIRTATQDEDDDGLHLVEGRRTQGANIALEQVAEGLHRNLKAGTNSLMNEIITSTANQNSRRNKQQTSSAIKNDSNNSLQEFLCLIQNDEHTFCLSEAVCKRQDLRIFDNLMQELSFHQMWMSGGTALRRPSHAGTQELFEKSPTYAEVVRFLVKKFKLSNPIRSIVNLYRDGTDSTGMHRDQYFGEANFTCGVSFGALRELEFLQEVDYQNMMQQLNQGYYGTTSEQGNNKKFTFPQHNGDIFAFSNVVNSRWRHAVPKLVPKHKCGPRISLVLWGCRRGENKVWDYEEACRMDPLGFEVKIIDSPHLKYEDPKLVGDTREGNNGKNYIQDEERWHYG